MRPVTSGLAPTAAGGATLVFCPNLAVDHILEIDALAPGEVQHASSGVLSAGGKGLNLARAGRCLGVETQVIGLVGGRTGALLTSLLHAEEMAVLSPALARETRIATIVHDRAAGTTTVLNERGPTVTLDEWAAMTDLVTSRLPGAAVLICTGSLPPGVPEDGYVELIEAGKRLGVPVIIDASAQTLMRCAEASPEIIKVNLEEAESATGGAADGPSVSRACAAARRLQAVSGNAVVVTVAGGAALAGRDYAIFLPAPPVAVRNPVGAGDSFLAGLASGLIEHGDLLMACQRAVAVATASVETPQPGWLDRARADELEQMIVPRPVTVSSRPPCLARGPG